MTRNGGRSGWIPATSWFQASELEEGKNLGWLYLVLMTLLAALLRFSHLGAQSLWVDEVMTWRGCRPDADLRFWSQIFDTFQGPLYLAVLWPLVRIEASEVLLRLPAALAGVATVPVFALVTRRWFGVRAARLGALLLTISPFHIWYSQEARGYAFVILFSVACSLVFLQMIQHGTRWRLVVLYVWLGAAAVWSSLSAIFLPIAHGVTLLLVARPRTGRQWGHWCVAGAGVLLLVLPWLLKASGIWAVDRLVPGSDTGIALRGSTTFSPLALPFTVYSFFFGFSLGPSLRELHRPDHLVTLTHYWPMLLVAAGVVVVALTAGLTRLQRQQWGLLVWIGLPVLIVVVLALRNIKPYNPRYLAVVFPWILLLATWGLLVLRRPWSQGFTLALVILFLGSLRGHYFDTRYAKDDVRAAAFHVARNEVLGDGLVVPVVTGVFRFYYPGRNAVADSYGIDALRDTGQARQFLQTAVGDAQRCWVVLARSWFVDPEGWLPRILDEEGEILDEQRWPGVRLLLWRPPRSWEAADAR